MHHGMAVKDSEERTAGQFLLCEQVCEHAQHITDSDIITLHVNIYMYSGAALQKAPDLVHDSAEAGDGAGSCRSLHAQAAQSESWVPFPGARYLHRVC